MVNEIYFIDLPYGDDAPNDLFTVSEVAILDRKKPLNRFINAPGYQFPVTEEYCKNHHIDMIEVLLKDRAEADALYSSISGKVAQTTDTLTEDCKYWLEKILEENNFVFKNLPNP